MVILSKKSVSTALFDRILLLTGSHIHRVESLLPYQYGTNDKSDILYDEAHRELIIQESLLYVLLDMEDKIDTNSWRQIIIKEDETKLTDTIEREVTGCYAWMQMSKMLKRYYTPEELEEAFKTHEAEYDYNKAQKHYMNISVLTDTVTLHHNCLKYDINGAHLSALVEIFPKAGNKLIEMYKARKQHPEYKKYFNFFVGEMCRRGHRLTYNWIVQRTTARLLEGINYVGGDLVYVNTDGFAVKNYVRPLPASTELGNFKLEHSGDLYTYAGKNYTALQWIDQYGELKTVGSILIQMREHLCLPAGQVIDYKRTVRKVCEDYYGNDINTVDASEVRVRYVEVTIE